MSIKNNIDKGKFCERQAITFFQQQGWKLIAKNHRVGGVEIDLIMKKADTYLLVEVKSDNLWRQEYPIKKNQKQRLLQAFSAFCEQYKKPVQTLLAIVDQKGNVQPFDLEF
ncbi:MAG: hypothetical protein F4X95_02505 [Oligoflexia bacterium]|nr:YraN family protein [Bdellovibrionales bacterium]MYE07607.1 hypothetical protein [Oligoflexia bacterium]